MINNFYVVDFFAKKSKHAFVAYGFNNLAVKFYLLTSGLHVGGDFDGLLRNSFPCCYSSHIANETGDFFTVYAVESTILAN